MDVNKIVCINRAESEQWCVFAHHWCGIPVFVTRDDNQSRSALYKDGTCFIILGSDVIKNKNPKILYNRLWHEVAHLYYRDVWKPWDIRFEFRADLVASAATGKDISLDRLNSVKNSATNPDSIRLVEKRIHNLVTAKNTYSKAEAFQMLRSLKPVTITSSVRGSQYI
jgi:hypothetical protein